ncbi:HPr family phosphocarrier protein [Brevibacillus sp. TJ4]|uniref:HPr family phosphocarrier protein n=1 Tax=Brevibacillus sp. TJ4 TaxID=3234853 RepID=UPI0037D7B911
MNVIEKEIEVGRPDGIHARPAGELMKRMRQFESTVELQFGDKKVDAKSIIQLMSLAIKQGNVVAVRISGEDAAEALNELELFLRGDNGL